jgi:hypothetical protein
LPVRGNATPDAVDDVNRLCRRELGISGRTDFRRSGLIVTITSGVVDQITRTIRVSLSS